MTVISRAMWGAADPRPRTPQRAKDVQEFFLHWPGEVPRSWARVTTPGDERQTMRDIQRFHMGPERGWADFAYSFAVFLSGRVYRGRGMPYVPAAQLGHNPGTVAVVVFMGPDDDLTHDAAVAIRHLRTRCETSAGHPLTVRPHGAVTPTECPGPQLRKLIRDGLILR